jgi:uncharacterized protein YjbI with pentapeptide repeats
VADKELVDRLRKSVTDWNHWRRDTGEFGTLRDADLSGADLHDIDLRGAALNDAKLTYGNLSGANLSRTYLKRAILNGTNLGGANLSGAFLEGTELRGTDLSGADLKGAHMMSADLSYATLRGTNLSGADLRHTNLSYANPSEADLEGALLDETALTDIDLTRVIGLETCQHLGPSIIDFRTLAKSHPLPLVFLQGVGLPDTLIDYLPSLLSQPIQYYKCFISYSSKDDGFATRVHADLQSKGVRCWFAPHDLPIGGKILDEIDAAIRMRDKVVLILSEHSIKSDWVEDEVNTAYEEERKRGQTVLFPIRLDDTVMQTKEAWAAKLRAARNIGDFRQWKDHDRYREVFERMLRDLAASPKRTK